MDALTRCMTHSLIQFCICHIQSRVFLAVICDMMCILSGYLVKILPVLNLQSRENEQCGKILFQATCVLPFLCKPSCFGLPALVVVRKKCLNWVLTGQKTKFLQSTSLVFLGPCMAGCGEAARKGRYAWIWRRVSWSQYIYSSVKDLSEEKHVNVLDCSIFIEDEHDPDTRLYASLWSSATAALQCAYF